MAKPFYRVNGVDILPFICQGGLEWEENNIEAPNAGRNLAGDNWHKVVARKDKHTISFRPLKINEIQTLTNALRTNDINVETNIHPRISGTATFNMYSSKRRAAVFTLTDSDEGVWAMDSISLTEN